MNTELCLMEKEYSPIESICLKPFSWDRTQERRQFLRSSEGTLAERRRFFRIKDEEKILKIFPEISPENSDENKAKDSPNLYSLFKRLIDVTVAAGALIALSPILISVAIIVKTSSKGPVIFSQKRVGQCGHLFKLYKFRTMVQNSESLKASLKTLNEQSGPVFKIKKDPRITNVGGFLRKYSIDELPQLFNILLGDMSLVGPRPPLPEEVAQYKIWQTRRLATKPGLTCIWQVSGRSQVQFEDWVRMDLRYIDTKNIWLDIILILKTFRVVVTGDGAY